MNPKSNWTFGAELELADVDTRLPLPDGAAWNGKDYTIANSCGVGNDPKRELVKRGGEVNTAPCSSPAELAAHIGDILNCFGESVSVNHTTNFHVHVRVPGLSENLLSLKRLARYVYENQARAQRMLPQIPKPVASAMAPEEFKGAMVRFKRRQVSHHKKLGLPTLQRMLEAKTPREFYEAHAPLSKAGVPQWQFATRCGINLQQLWGETDTVEFRHWQMSLDVTELRNAIEWCNSFLEAALITGAKVDTLPVNPMPQFQPYDHARQLRFNYTHFGKLTREEVKANLDSLLASGAINKEDILCE